MISEFLPDYFNLSAFETYDLDAKTVIGLKLQLKGYETQLNSLILHQTDFMKNWHKVIIVENYN